MTAPRVGVVARPQLAPEHLVDAVRGAEAAGVDEVWLWEDCFLAGGLTASTAALAGTASVRVGLGLMPAPLRNPALAAMEIAALARLYPGRFVPALGHGVLDWMAQVGARAESPMTLLRETTAAVRALLHGDEVTTAGRYVRLDGVRLDHPPHAVPPLLLGARGPRTLRLAGEVADGVVLDRASTAEEVAAAVATAGEGRSAAGAPTTPLEVVVYLEPGADPAAQATELADAGATSVIFQPPADSPGPQAVLDAARSALGRSI